MEALKLLSSYAKDVCNGVEAFDVCVTLTDNPQRLIISDINGAGYEIIEINDTTLEAWVMHDPARSLNSCRFDINNQPEFEKLLEEIRTYITHGIYGS